MTITKKPLNILKTALLGGVAVLLPVAILLLILTWLFGLIHNIISPLAKLIEKSSAMSPYLADFFAIALVIGTCFLLGIFVKTKLGALAHRLIESLLGRIPGYTLIRETVSQFTSKKKRSPFQYAALARPFGNDTLMTVLITDEHDGMFTVFAPTGPNPTSGLIFHLPHSAITILDLPIDQVMRTVISCGAGSEALLSSGAVIPRKSIPEDEV